MSFLDYDRFHRAARDGYLDLLQEGNRKELNSQDEDGMTPAMWAAYYGHLDALRLIVGRGGDPDKCDHYGNTPLHCSSGNGHMDCVSFLVNFGVNLWALDNDFHTAKDVSVLNHRDDVLRLLDQAQSKHALVNKKLVQKLKEKSVADADKRVKNYRKLQIKAARRAEKEEKILERQRKRMSESGNNEVSVATSRFVAFRRDSRFLYAPKFSDIVLGGDKKGHGAVSKKVGQHRKKGVEFKLGEIIEMGFSSDPETKDGTPRTDLVSEVIFASKTDSECDSSSNKDSNPDTIRSSNEPLITDVNSSDDSSSELHHTADSGIGDELVVNDSTQPAVSIFDRPGFGTMAFRNSIINLPTLENGNCIHNHLNHENKEQGHHDSTNGQRSYEPISQHALNPNGNHREPDHGHSHCASDSIGSASSLVRRHISWEDEYVDDQDDDDYEVDAESDDDDSDDDDGGEPIVLFLSALGLTEYAPLFQAEKIDLESLSLLSEDDLKVLGMPLGPRRKLEKALEQRVKAFEEPGVVQDSKL